MQETRVNLKHLLEDIRDSYPCPIEEAILTELVANSLDSDCSRIDIRLEPQDRWLTFVDDGEGMGHGEFRQYHDIASTTKVRGKGIGFAGVGSKLALLVCDDVVTETRRAGSSVCSRWWLETDVRAPWVEVSSPGMIAGQTGTAVRLNFRVHPPSDLLKYDFVESAIRCHFYPLLDEEFTEFLYMYPRGILIAVNDEPVVLGEMNERGAKHFLVRVGKRKEVAGIGLVVKSAEPLPEEQRGLAISTYGKVIKRGWDWLGITPNDPRCLTGVVEVPPLVECLTTNKCDFLRDPNSLQKYYKYRKAIQEAVARVLEELGEARPAERHADREIQKLQREIDKVVREILPDFPELLPLFGRKSRADPEHGFLRDAAGDVSADTAAGTDVTTGDKGGCGEGNGMEEVLAGPLHGFHLEPVDGGAEASKEHVTRRKRPGLMIGFDDTTGGEHMGRLQGNTLFINVLHPAYRRVQSGHGEALYIVFVVASTLSAHVEEGRPPVEFVQRFMAAWGSME